MVKEKGKYLKRKYMPVGILLKRLILELNNSYLEAIKIILM